MASEIVGYILIGLGVGLLLLGAVLATAEQPQQPGTRDAGGIPWDKVLDKILDLLPKLIAEFGKLRPAGQLMVSGLICIGAGIVLEITTPF